MRSSARTRGRFKAGFPVACAPSHAEQLSRKDLSEQLAKADHNMDVKLLLQAIQTTVDFEGKLHKRFDPRVSRSDVEEGMKAY